jgi:hypothetical protein
MADKPVTRTKGQMHDIEVEQGGVKLRGVYVVENDVVTVRSVLGTKATPLVGPPHPEDIARQLLLELLAEPKAGF